MANDTLLVHFDDPERLLAFLRPSHGHWRSWLDGWLFRGQTDAGWKLRPAIHRDEALAKIAGVGDLNIPEVRRSGLLTVLRAEISLVAEFVRLADDAGLTLPVGAGELLSYNDLDADYAHLFDDWGNWPPVSLRPTFALAQHHRIPTRFLDWTSDPLTALFFAASGVIEDPDSIKAGQHAGVWAVGRGATSLGEMGSRPINGQQSVLLVRVPQWENAYLRAQRGLFTLDRAANMEMSRTGRWPEYASLPAAGTGLVDPADKEVSDAGSSRVLVTFRVEQANWLLDRLAAEGTTRARLHPSFAEVARVVRVNQGVDDPISP